MEPLSKVIRPEGLLPYTCARLSPQGIRVGEFTCSELASRFGTPLFVIDVQFIRQQARTIRAALAGYPGTFLPCYALKANANHGVLQILGAEQFGADAASAGELDAALRAGISPDQIVFNGNAKSDQELALAIQAGIKAVIVDSRDELETLNGIASQLGAKAPIALRVNVQAHASTATATAGAQVTFDTSTHHSKFGVTADEARALYRRVGRDLRHLEAVGIHTHIGSQIQSPGDYREAATTLLNLLPEVDPDSTFEFIDLGGGMPVPYLFWSHYTGSTPTHDELEARFDMATFGAELCATLVEGFSRIDRRPLELILEPGRFLVAGAGLTLATVRAAKEAPHRWLTLDAGCHTLADCWTYHWFFECLPIDEAQRQAPTTLWDLAGPLCDSGDIVGRDRLLPRLHRGDRVALLQTGAYQIEQQSHFNLFLPAPLVLVERRHLQVYGRPATPDPESVAASRAPSSPDPR